MSKVNKNREKFLGQEFDTVRCGKCKIVDYYGTHNIIVEFHEPFCLVKCRMINLKRGNVKNPLKPTFYGKGYIGLGEFSSKDKRHLEIWTSVLERCYSEICWESNPTYKDVEVCKDWLDFQNFASWCESQKFFNAKDDKGNLYQLDKDILVRGNRLYSPETCRFVPSCINKLLISCKKRRGDLPVGVFLEKSTGKYGAQLQDGSGRQKKLGTFTTPEDAFLVYKIHKEDRVKCMAECWKDMLDFEIYESLLDYKVDILD